MAHCYLGVETNMGLMAVSTGDDMLAGVSDTRAPLHVVALTVDRDDSRTYPTRFTRAKPC